LVEWIGSGQFVTIAFRCTENGQWAGIAIQNHAPIAGGRSGSFPATSAELSFAGKSVAKLSTTRGHGRDDH
jgi:hypothetical protein